MIFKNGKLVFYYMMLLVSSVI